MNKYNWARLNFFVLGMSGGIVLIMILEISNVV